MATIRVQGSSAETVFRNIEAVLFDKDGTLANVAAYLTALGCARSQQMGALIKHEIKQANAVCAAVLAAFGLGPEGIDPAGLLAVGSRYENEIAAAACLSAIGWGWIEAASATRDAFVRAEEGLAPKVTQTPLLPGVLTVLRRLKAADVAIGIVSSDTHAEVAAFVSYYQLTGVDWYCGAAAATLPKTHTDFLRFACRAMDVHSSATLIVGDSAADYVLSTNGAAGFVGTSGGWELPVAILPSTAEATATGAAITEIPTATVSSLLQVEAFD